LEVHVQLKTKSKIFCGCRNEFGGEPNSFVCPICLGYPGSLPAVNEDAIRRTVLTGLMLGSRIGEYSKFDRKSYFYPDMPKNYQISQYDKPLCIGGKVEIDVDGRTKVVGITRIHLEEDVGKNMHFETSSGIDFNRAGTPLMEIVSEPDMESADEAFAFLLALKQILVYGDISDCNLEQGNMRCDVNCSVRPEGQKELGTKTEIKNMNTFKGVHRALKYEIQRQIDEVTKGGKIVQETRRWDDELGATTSMRSKEYAHDYRYFPEPDLMPVVISREQVEAAIAGAAAGAARAVREAVRHSGIRRRRAGRGQGRRRLLRSDGEALRQFQGGFELGHDRHAPDADGEGDGHPRYQGRAEGPRRAHPARGRQDAEHADGPRGVRDPL
jgi:aspartyl-tRNA(Asn)/glutamyl-tRNA(Gln) amidotransferase subunit B